MERKTISIMKACELVGVSRRTIYNWLSSGKIEYVRTAGGSVRIFVDTLWRDPHNTDRRFTRARLRHEALPLLEDILGGGVAEALARTAAALQDDGDVLDGLALRVLVEGRSGATLPVAVLSPLPAALRRRVIRGWLGTDSEVSTDVTARE